MNLRKIAIPVKNPLVWLYVAGGLLLIAAAGLWCFKLSVEPERVFWKTVERGLATGGVTIEADQENGDATVRQVIRYSLGANNLSHSRTVFTQGNTRAVSEMLGTLGADYSRYVSIKTDQKKKDGRSLDLSKIVGVWAKSDQGGQVFSQAVLGGGLPVGGMVVPIGKLDPEARGRLLRKIQDDAAYKVDFSKVKKKRADGRLLYTYEVEIQPVAYVALMKNFAQALGLHDLDSLDPQNYKGQPAFKVELTIDARAQQAVTAVAVENKSRQTYSGYGLPVQAALPAQTISTLELQKRLSDLQ